MLLRIGITPKLTFPWAHLPISQVKIDSEAEFLIHLGKSYCVSCTISNSNYLLRRKWKTGKSSVIKRRRWRQWHGSGVLTGNLHVLNPEATYCAAVSSLSWEEKWGMWEELANLSSYICHQSQ